MKKIKIKNFCVFVAMVASSAVYAGGESIIVENKDLSGSQGTYFLVRTIPTPAVLSISDSPIQVQEDSQDLIFVDGNIVVPAYNAKNNSAGADSFYCSKIFFGASTHPDQRSEYSPCRSSLTKVKSISPVKNIFLIAITGGLAAAMGAYTYELEIDNDAVKKLASDLDLMDSAKFQNSVYAIKRQQEKYFSDFNSARTINQFLSFINTYKDSDPSNLIPRAEAQIKIIKERDRLLSEKLKEEQDFIKNSALTTKNLEGSLGKRICLDTTLTYSYDTGSSNYSEGRIFETIREPGTIYAAIDGYEIKNRKIKIVVSGHKTPNGKLKRNPASEIRSYDIVATPGAQLWTDIDGWRFCR